ncbi:hypothetical protein, partial [Paraburkholderia atlantica]|uniref:hypothetical protein n=1 Tax=Paraburkholderia atlantica TaxID=2654982 RepID=UPI001C850EB0
MEEVRRRQLNEKNRREWLTLALELRAHMQAGVEVRIPRKSSSRTAAKRADIPREAERGFHSKASA